MCCAAPRQCRPHAAFRHAAGGEAAKPPRETAVRRRSQAGSIPPHLRPGRPHPMQSEPVRGRGRFAGRQGGSGPCTGSPDGGRSACDHRALPPPSTHTCGNIWPPGQARAELLPQSPAFSIPRMPPAPMAGQRVGRGAQWVAPASVAPVPGWKPSAYFEEWKKEVGRTKDNLALDYIQYCGGMPASARKHAIESILRQTMPYTYRSSDGGTALDAMDNDLYAMWEYATRFFDEFWEGFCAQFWRGTVGPEWDWLRPRS